MIYSGAASHAVSNTFRLKKVNRDNTVHSAAMLMYSKVKCLFIGTVITITIASILTVSIILHGIVNVTGGLVPK